MRSLTQATSCLIASGLWATALGQMPPKLAPIPRDPLELAGGEIQQIAGGTADRAPTLQLLARARNNYALRNLKQAWDLKVHFAVDSSGQTSYDGGWDMEDIFSPGEGLHWSAKSTAGYAVTGIFGATQNYVESTASVIPLRLQEARAMLYNPIPSVAYAGSGSLRTAAATFHGSPVVCVLLSHSRNAAEPSSQRGWDENEECIDSQSGLLMMHSEAPGRYAVYDYTNAPRLGSHVLPRTVTVMEGGRVVSTLSLQSLETIPSVDSSLFVPTEAMMAAPAVAMTSATKISRIQGQGPVTSEMTLLPVCVFGLVTPAGRLVEAHSLQPSDPNSEAAVKDAEAINFSPSMPAGAPPQQHFVFVIEKFVSTK